jgi:membrane protein DedA with SNARE-associated domain
MSASKLVYAFGLLQAIVVAVGAYLAQPNDPVGRPLVIALIGIAVSAAVSFVAGRKVNAAVAREVKKAQVFP